jgi:hypothetical protein
MTEIECIVNIFHINSYALVRFLLCRQMLTNNVSFAVTIATKNLKVYNPKVLVETTEMMKQDYL